MPRYTVKLDARKLTRHIRRFNASVLPLTARHFFLEGEEIIGEAKEEYVPVDTGTLKNSGHVKPPVIQGTRVKVELGFGGPAAAYALFVHEDLTANHIVGQAKYLEIPFKQQTPGMSGRLAQRIRKEMRKQFRG